MGRMVKGSRAGRSRHARVRTPALAAWLALGWGAALAGGQGGPVVLSDAPFVRQGEAECGPASLAMVLRFWGSDADRPSLVRSMGALPRDGASAADLKRAAEASGFEVHFFKGDRETLSRLLRQGRPLIVALAGGKTSAKNHFVVLIGRDAARAEWIVHDPARGPFRRITDKRFNRAWERLDRWTLLVTPRAGRGLDPAGGRRDDGSGGSDAHTDRSVGSGEIDCDDSVRAAISLARQDRFADAEAALETRIRSAGACSDAYWELAGVRYRRGDRRGAVAALRAGLKLDPEDAYGHTFLATLLQMVGRPLPALAHWNRAGRPRVAHVAYRGFDPSRSPLPWWASRFSEGEVLHAGEVLEAQWARERLLADGSFGWRLVKRKAPDWDIEIDVATAAPLRRRAVLVGHVLQFALNRDVRVQSAARSHPAVRWRLDARWHSAQRAAAVEIDRVLERARPGRLTFAANVRDERYRVPGSLPAFDYKAESIKASIELLPGRRSSVSTLAGLQRQRFAPFPGGQGQAEPSVLADLGLQWDQRFGLTMSDSAVIDGTARFDVTASPGGRSWHRGSIGFRVSWTPRFAPRLAVRGGAGAGRGSTGLPFDRRFLFGPGLDGELLLRAHPARHDGTLGSAPRGRAYHAASFDARFKVAAFGPIALGAVLFCDAARVSSPSSGPNTPKRYLDVGGGAYLQLPTGEAIECLAGHDAEAHRDRFLVNFRRTF